MRLFCYSLAHETTALDVREQASLGPHEMGPFLEALAGSDGVEEALALSTCNRTELYVVTSAASDPDLAGELARFKAIDPALLTGAIITDEDVIRHAFALVCGLRSLVLGETEILGQVKRAYADAVSCGAAGKILNSLFQRAFAFAKHIRTGTEIGRFRVSVASVAIDEALQRMPELDGKKVAVYGTGPVGRAVVAAFAKAGVTGGTVLGRNLHRARTVSDEWDGEACRGESLTDALAQADLFVSCTGAPHTLIHTGDVGDRSNRPLLLIDLAVPRDVAAEVEDLSGVTVIDMDTVGAIRQQGLSAREKARSAVEPLLDQEADQLWKCLNAAMSERCLADWRGAAHDALEAEQARLFAETTDFSREQREQIEEMTHRLLHRLLSWPMKAMACAMRDGLPCADVYPEMDLPSTLDETTTGSGQSDGARRG